MQEVASETEAALKTSGNRPPGVSDSIEIDEDIEVTRRASEKRKVLGEASRIEGIVAEYGFPT